MVYITGDTHRNFDDVEEFCSDYCTSTDDILIILGDAGINFRGQVDDSRLKLQLSELPITLFCIHGNHEMRPESIYTYEEIEAFGGTAYGEEEYPNLIFAKDGEIYDIGGRKCIAIGGAYSIDKFTRTPGVDWWPDEQPDEYTKLFVEKQLDSVNWRVDIVFSHTCPKKYIPTETFSSHVDQSTIDRSTEEWLDKIEDKLGYEQWYCGHWHMEKYCNKMRFLFNSIEEFEEE